MPAWFLMVMWCIDEGCYSQENSASSIWVSSLSELTSAVSTAAVQFVTIITHAAEHPWKVLAGSKHTDVLEITLIDVWGERDKMLGTLPWIKTRKAKLKQERESNATERVWHLDRPCCLLWEWSPSHTRSGSHPERSDTGRSHTGSRCLRTHPCLKQNRPVSYKAHCTLHGYPIRIYLEGQQSNQSRKIHLHWSPPCMYTCRIPVCWHSLRWDCSCGPLQSTHPDLKRKKMLRNKKLKT